MLISASIIWESIYEQWIGIWLLIDTVVYHFISFMYQKFIVLASLRLFDNDVYQTITDSIYMIIGVIALFLIAYQILVAMINVDDKKSGESIKKIILNIITSMVLLAIVPTIFDFLFDFQNSILSNNVLGKIFLPTYSTQTEYGFDTDDDNIIDTEHKFTQEEIDAANLATYGHDTATQVFQGFFYPTNADNKSFDDSAKYIIVEDISTVDPVVAGVANTGVCIGGIGAGLKIGTFINPGVGTAIGGVVGLGVCGLSLGITALVDLFNKQSVDMSLYDAYNYASATGNFTQFKYFGEFVLDTDEDGNDTSNQITYHYGFSTIVGGIIVYILAIYCLDVAVRAAKLAFYEMLAPIPILMKSIPKQDGIFKNWLKCVGSCYFEVFIRLAALYLATFLIANLPDMISIALDDKSIAYKLSESSFGLGPFVKANVILGIFIFIKQIPKLIGDITGIKSEKFSLNILDHMKEASWAAAGVGGLIAGRSPVSAIRAGLNGWKNNNLKGIGAEYNYKRDLRQAKEEGSTWLGRTADRARRILGFESGVDAMKRNTDNYYNNDTNRQMQATNDSGTIIGRLDSNGNVIEQLIGLNDNYELNKQSVDTLQELLANIATRNSELNEEGKILKARRKQNDTLIAYKGKLEDLADKEIRKNKYRLKDQKGNDLKLSYRKLGDDGNYIIDSNGNYIYETIEHSNLAQFEEWFDVHKERMSSDDLKELSDIYKKSTAVYTKEAFINSNGMEEERDSAGKVIRDANGNTIFTKAHEDTIAAKKDVAFDVINKGFTQVDGTSQNDTYKQLLKDLEASGIDINSDNLFQYITIDVLKSLKDEGETLNRGAIADKERENSLIQSKYDDQKNAIDRILNQGKEQQEVQKQSKRYKAAQANSDITKKGGN